MSSSELSISLQREELMRNLLPRSQLAYVEEHFPGVVRLELCRRTRAIIELVLDGYQSELLIYYHLPPEDGEDHELQIESGHASWLKREYPELWALARHRACEAMIALRNGHKEYVRTRKRVESDT